MAHAEMSSEGLISIIQRSWVSEIPETKETSDWLASTRIRRLARILHGNITCLEIGTDTCRLVHYDYNASLALYSCCSLATWRCWPELGQGLGLETSGTSNR